MLNEVKHQCRDKNVGVERDSSLRSE